MCNTTNNNTVKHVKFLQEKTYETKDVKVIVRFFEQDMVLLLVMHKSDRTDESVTYNHFSTNAYFNAYKGDEYYVNTKKVLSEYEDATRWFRYIMSSRYSDFFDINWDYTFDETYLEYESKCHKCVAEISKWYDINEKNVLLDLFPDVDPVVHDFCNIRYSFPCAKFHICNMKLANPYDFPYPEAKHLPYSTLTRAYPVKILHQDSIIELFKRIDNTAYGTIQEVIAANQDYFIELVVNWMNGNNQTFRLDCQIYSKSGKKRISLIEDNRSEDTIEFEKQ